ncbi:MAG TPA: GIY-YIG nuclease family protein, partial [Prosthecobacter sp.]|nr:GIY-YIG nuclease family protein [Prosthecobacter sp.]
RMSSQGAYVYIIAPEQAETPCKVGISDKPWARLSALQIGSPVKLRVVEIYEFDSRDDAFRMEKEFHQSYAEWRLHGEWFDINADDANYFLFENTVAVEVWGA